MPLFFLASVVSKFSAIAAAHPDALAVVDRDRCLTYGELDRRAGLLAATLIRRGISPEDPVGLLLDRSPELYLGMIAVLKCGGCYVPLDPVWPRARHAFVAENTGCKVILSVSGMSVPPGLEPRTIRLDRFDWSASAEAVEFPPDDLKRLAYILYTSGSTGTPKGVEIEHAGLANFVEWQLRRFPHRRTFRTTQAARPGFDASGSEIWPALCSGATLFIVPSELLLDPEALAKWLADSRIDECFLPTPLAELLMEVGMPPDSALRILRVGGDRLTRKPPADFPAIVVDEYGPTECSIVSTCAIHVPGEPPEPPPNIGIPIDNCRVSVRDEALAILPDGVPGEICVGGVGLARGYHRSPELDAGAFVADPVHPGNRIYRTGDLGIRRFDGRFEFLGRKDFQVKLHGQRIELGEIEGVIASHPAVAKCVACVRTSDSGGKTLAAYVTLRHPVPGIVAELSELARERLPEYMVPASVSVLEAFPLTPNGKIDRAALPSPEAETPPQAWRAPEGECEKKLAALWQAQLKCPPPGRDDHYFRLGGDSLLAVGLAVEIGREFDFDASAELVFEHPVLHELAVSVARRAGTGVSVRLRRGEDGAARSRFPATSYQAVQWKLQRLTGRDGWNNIVIGVHLEGEVDPSLLCRVFTHIVQNSQSLRSGFVWDGTRLEQRVAEAVEFELPYHDWSGGDPARRDERFEAKIGEHRSIGFDLAAPPLFRAELIRLGERRFELLFTVSHLIFDGWSASLFLIRLRDDYLRLKSGGTLPPVCGDQPDYAEFAECHRRQLESGYFLRGLAEWRKLLADLPVMPELPFERGVPSGDKLAAGHYRFRIPNGFCSKLKLFAAESGTTLFTLLQAVLHLQLHKYTGVTDIVTGTAFANRKVPNSESIIGMFINSLPLRHRLDPEESFSRFLEHFRHTVRRCAENSDVPLDFLLEHCGLAARRAPLFPVSLLLQNLPWPEDDAPGLCIDCDDLGNGIAKTNLMLVIEERRGGLDCCMEYREAIFSRESVISFCDAFQAFAGTLLERPEVPVSELCCPLPAGSRSGAYLVGDTGLVPACGDILREKGFQVLGVFSDDPPVCGWAGGLRIPVYPPTAKNFRTVMRRIPFDYLFSVVNSHVIAEEVLALPKKMAVNYHDSPLPRYAGLNACCRAVIDRESSHAVTWHRMTAELDAGDICVQRPVPLPPDATAVALSLACSEAAVAAFSELADALAGGTLQPVPQDLSQRTCFTAADRPYAGAMLDWARAPEELCALVRGLDLGPYDNEMALPKFLHNGKIVVSGEAEVVAGKSDGFGLIVSVDSAAVTVAAGGGLIRLGKLSDSSGNPVTAESFAVGESLLCSFEYEFDALDRAYHAAARNEPYWQRIFSELEPPVIPLLGWDALPAGEGSVGVDGCGGFEPALLFALFLARLGGNGRVDLPLKASGQPFGALPPDFLLEFLPLRIEADFERGATENLEAAGKALEKWLAHPCCPGDLLLRRKKTRRFPDSVPALERDPDGSTRLFHCGGERAGQLLKLFNAFCRNVMAYPERPLKWIRMQTEEEFRREVFDWNATAQAFTLDTTYARLFADRLPEHEDRIAVVAGERRLTYLELDRESARIARLLRNHGAAPGDTVGICMVRSVELAAALLGVFKAGCAYLALEPGQFPPERRKQMLEDGEASILLFFDPETPGGGQLDGIDVVDLAAELETVLIFADDFIPEPGNGDENAYLMFTSGSTGTPKAVMVSQRNLLNHNRAVIEAFGLGPEDRVLQFGSLSFDLSVEELFPILLAGGTLVFRSGRVPPSPSELLDFARKEGVTVFDLPTAYWHSMTANLEAKTLPPSLRLVVIGGEHASAERVRRWRELAPHVRLLNTYGPTETTVIATMGEDPDTIGRPIANTVCYILDRFGQPCPPGCPGEILIGGESVSKGYINNPERNAIAFLPDPFRPGQRVYRSGDIGCYTERGEIVCLGRADRQVKLRGFRVELESVEAALRQLPGVEDAAVTVHRSPSGAERLDGYVVGNPGSSPDAVRERLARTLPEFMVPATVTFLSALPVTPTGKIDRKALPEPALSGRTAEEEPDSMLEMQISLIFKRLLGLESVDYNRSFFDLGGDSLSALNLCLEVERICGNKLSMEEFYRNSSVKGLAAGLANRCGNGQAWDSPVLLADGGDGIPLYLVHTTPGDVFGYVNLAGQLAGRKVYAFQAYGLNPENEPHRTIPEMAAYYVKVLRERRPHGPYFLAGWCFGGTVAYEMACQLSEAGEEVGFLGLIETWGRPPLSIGHLFRQGWSLFGAGPRVWVEYGKEKIGGNHPGETPADGLDFIAARFGGSRGRQEIEHLKKLYAVNMRAIRNYTMRHYRGTVELFCVSLADLSGVIPDSRRRWTGLADRIVIEEFHGGSHADILKPPQVDQVAEAVNAALAAADDRSRANNESLQCTRRC